MKAIIMAGGEGKRLRPITCTMPKPMVPVLNRPIVDYTMDLIKKHGIREAVYTLNYMGGVIKNHIGDGSAWGIRVQYSDPGRKLGTAGSVREAIGEANERVLVLSGDGITDIDIEDAEKSHVESGAAVTIVLKKVDDPTEYGVALLDDDGMITRFIEKPERNRVFSDFANTGIYIIEPQVLNMIPKDTDFDFSKDLFPKLMSEGIKIHGYRMEGYWCDIGDISEYRRAQRDMLDGKCVLDAFRASGDKDSQGGEHELGNDQVSEREHGHSTCIARDFGGVFVEPNANISGRAKLIPPCYIGSGTVIGDGVCIEPYTVIGSNSIIEYGSGLKRSIIFENVHIRSNTEIRGAVVCEDAHIDERACLYEGSTVGAATHIGIGVSVMPNVSIWPHKEIEGGVKCRDNIMWGNSTRRISIDGSRIAGYADNQLTPEAALRVGASFASLFSAPKKLAVCTDGSQVAVMLKYSIISGIASQGIDALVINPMSKSPFAYTVSQSGCCGGIYISGTDARGAVITVYSEDGIEAAPDTMRSIKNAFVFGERLPSVDKELGIITQHNGLGDAYEHRLIRSVDSDLLRKNPKTLRITADEQLARSVSRVMLQLNWNVETVTNSTRLIPARDEDTLVISYDKNGMLSMAVGGEIAGEQMIDTAIVIEAAENRGLERIVLPVTMPESYRNAIKAKGVEISFAPEEKSSLRRAAQTANAYYAPLCEPEAAIIKLCEIFARGELKRRIEELPIVYSAEKTVRASWRDMGRMLRTLAEGDKQADRELIDGIRLKYDTGWVVVRPSGGTTAAFRVISGSTDSEYAKELCDIYVDKLNSIRDGKSSENK